MSLFVSRSSGSSLAGFGLILAGMGAMLAGASAPSPFYPILQQEMGFSAAMMTGIFAVYAIFLLATLLMTGSLSDHVGRRPVLSAGFTILAVSIVLFWQAGSPETLLVARAIQGIASGLLLSTLSATAVDLEPKSRPGSAAIWNSVIPLAGLAIGALVAGIALDFSPTPKTDVFGGLTLLYLVLAGLIWTLPETSSRLPNVLSCLRPQIGLPKSTRAAFLRSSPAVVAGWATGGLYLSLGTPIVDHVFDVHDTGLQALVVTLLAGSGALACFAAQNRSARQITLFGTYSLALGTSLTLIGLYAQHLPIYLIGVAIAGAGFGTCFFGILRSIIPLAAPAERSELFASLFTLSYAAFGLPVVVAGVAMPHLGLVLTTGIYGGIIALFSGVAGLLRQFGTSD
ncbi:MFS transporter [Roseibium sp. CAU 1637]|uniref:MFS transporter n=1 Tax=Roseibium limicola TaxID=2816037 RepID=A0A939J8Z1_9HYPH|nr:MFS transporter [Roseibium limicola]MBO0345369.1 MFS transporter [Roseibium limicola]